MESLTLKCYLALVKYSCAAVFSEAEKATQFLAVIHSISSHDLNPVYLPKTDYVCPLQEVVVAESKSQLFLLEKCTTLDY